MAVKEAERYSDCAEFSVAHDGFKRGFDAAIAHLAAKQSVAFDEKKVLEFLKTQAMKPSCDSCFCDGALWKHQKTSLIYEAKLAIAVEALLQARLRLIELGECDKYINVGNMFTLDTLNEALEKLGAK